ncbi:hypothetical protein [Sorangium sp. So ce1078]|uniref:hypothetical protein n=1 Tax=Sorangium sp. So ce1078 TaxID=3133329 RepID=UPI003F5DB889
MIALATSAAAGAARAEDADPRAGAPAGGRFGGRGQVALDNVVGVTTEGGHLGPNMVAGAPQDTSWGATGYTGALGYTFSDTRSGDVDGYSVRSHTGWVSPSVDVFVIDSVSIGGTIGLSYTSQEAHLPDAGGTATSIDRDSFTLSVVPRVGYAVALSEPLTLWPRVGFGYSGTRADPIGSAGESSIMNAWIGVVDVGLVYRPSEHIYLHMAPELVMRLSSIESSRGGTLTGSASLDLGFTGGIGVLLGSRRDAPPPPALRIGS